MEILTLQSTHIGGSWLNIIELQSCSKSKAKIKQIKKVMSSQNY